MVALGVERHGLQTTQQAAAFKPWERMLMRIRDFTNASTLAAALALGLGSFAATTPDARAAGGTFIWGMSSEMNILDPHATCSWYTSNAIYNIFEGLVMLDLTDPNAKSANLKPAIAESWTLSDDGTVYTFKIRKGVKFHDGGTVDAHVVKWNYDRFMDTGAPQSYPPARATLAFYTRWIAKTEDVDDWTFRITLKQPNYEWLQFGVQACGMPMIMSPEAVKKYGNENMALHPTGTGPFKFVEREQNVKVVLERFDDYWGNKAKIERLIFRPLPDQATRLNAIRSGEVTMINEAPWDELASLKQEGFTIATNENASSIWLLFFNFKNPVMADLRVRKAINLAINRKGITDEILKGTGKPQYGMLNPGTFAYEAGYKPFDYNPEAAKALLAEAGYGKDHELNITFDIYEYGYNEVWEKWIQRDLKKVGINVKLNKIEWITYLGKWVKGMPPDLEMNEVGWGWSIPFWTQVMSRCDSQPPNGFNVGWYCNPEVDKLFDEAIKEKDKAKAADLYHKANDIIMGKDYAFAPKFVYFNPLVLSPKVKHFVNATENWYDFSVVELAE